MEATKTIGIILMTMLFYSFGITMLAHFIPADNLAYVDVFSSSGAQLDFEEVGEQLDDSIQDQINVPLIDLAALVFYSGNILIDFFLNFIFAFPQMVQILLSVMFNFMDVDIFIQTTVKQAVGIIVFVPFVLLLLSFILNMRSGRGVV